MKKSCLVGGGGVGRVVILKIFDGFIVCILMVFGGKSSSKKKQLIIIGVITPQSAADSK